MTDLQNPYHGSNLVEQAPVVPSTPPKYPRRERNILLDDFYGQPVWSFWLLCIALGAIVALAVATAALV